MTRRKRRAHGRPWKPGPSPTQQIPQAQASPEIDAVMDGDRRFFLRHTGRNYRMRLMARAEIASGEAAGFQFGPPREGMRWIVVLRQVHPGVRLRAFCQLTEGVDMDAPEAVCRDLYERIVSPETLDLGDRMKEAVRAALAKDGGAA